VNPSVFVEPEFTMRTSESIGIGVTLSIPWRSRSNTPCKENDGCGQV
jgi:hypothetical protein